MGFELNPYDQCVANKMINGKQCSIGFYVDDNISSNADDEVLTQVISELEKHVGKMVVTRGNVHIFLGMKITFNGDGTLSIQMSEYIQEAIDDFPGPLKLKASSPAKKDLFTVDRDSKPLDKERAEIFHSLTMKLMYVSQRSRIDVITTIAFLCTRVTKCTEQDWEKL
jgi:hypothetical protein